MPTWKLKERLLFGLPTLLFCFFLIYMDAEGYINVDKFGYAVIGGWITLLVNFYYRKATKEDKGE